MRKILLLLFILFSSIITAQNINLKSPDNTIDLRIKIGDKISYDLLYNNEILFESCNLQMQLRNETLGANPKLIGQKRVSVNENIKPIIPFKYSIVENNYNSLVLSFKGNYAIEFRAFNDGVAYRFITNKKGEVEVLDEDFSINFPADYFLHLQQVWNSFHTPYEEPYTHLNSSNFNTESKMSTLPIIVDTKKQCKILISDADVVDYPIMLVKGGNKLGVKGAFQKYPIEQEYKGNDRIEIVKEGDFIAKTNGKRAFPWRFFVIASKDEQIIENTMVCRLASPSKITNPSWIEPGQTVWDWWNYAMPYDVDFKAGRNQETFKYFIDFAADNNIPYTLIDEGWANSRSEPFKTNPNVNMPELMAYAKQKGIKVLLWMHWSAVENNMDTMFDTYSKWGISGLKIDFMERNDQWMVNFYERTAKKAAEHNMIVLFHGSFKPSGLEYIYPNILSYEGVKGLEWKQDCTPNNSIYLPFMRNAVGPMDYTPGAMMSMQPEFYANSDYNPAAIGTRANQLSHFIIFESGIQMLADNPTRYKKEKECFDFITQIPVTWDETIAIDAKVGEYVIIAKRKGEKWYIGAITNSDKDERTFEINLDFLSSGKTYQMTAFQDGPNANKIAMDYNKKESQVKQGNKLTIKLAQSGGWAAILK